MAFALFRTESDQRINVPIRTNTQRDSASRGRFTTSPLPITPEPDKTQVLLVSEMLGVVSVVGEIQRGSQESVEGAGAVLICVGRDCGCGALGGL